MSSLVQAYNFFYNVVYIMLDIIILPSQVAIYFVSDDPSLTKVALNDLQ